MSIKERILKFLFMRSPPLWNKKRLESRELWESFKKREENKK